MEAKAGKLSATLWSLAFAACLGLAVAHLVTTALEQTGGETSLIEATFTRAPAEP